MLSEEYQTDCGCGVMLDSRSDRERLIIDTTACDVHTPELPPDIPQ